MSRNLHTIEFREQALIKVRERGTRSVQDVANDLHMAVGTLRKWLSKSNQEKGEVSELAAQLPDDLPAQSWGAAQRLQALLETHAMSQTQLHAWCREKGLFEHQLKAWRDAFCSAPASDSRETKAALRELQTKHEGLQRELRRKEKALAEAAALLVLQKKFQALLGDED
jgi:transposase-like protein